MRLTLALLAAAAVSMTHSFAAGPTRDQQILNDRNSIEAAGAWIYDDLEKGFAEAKQTGKPLLVVLRCVP